MSMCGRQRSDAMIVFRFKAPTQTRGGVWRDVIQDLILLNLLYAGHGDSLKMKKIRGVKKKKRSASASLISLMAEEEGDVCGFPRWLATVQTDATIR